MEQPSRPFVTIVIPAHNEEENLCQTVQVLTETLDRDLRRFELLIVDDASRDRTGSLADQLSFADPRIRVFHHPENRGIGGGFITGVQNALGEWFMLVPADLALEPGDLGKYFELIHGSDIVVGIASNKIDYSPFRRLVSWLNIRLVQILFGMSERQFQYISLYRTCVLRNMEIEFRTSAFFWAEILIKGKAMGCRLVEVDIRYAERTGGQATGASAPLILRTGRDMIRFWLRGGWERSKR